MILARQLSLSLPPPQSEDLHSYTTGILQQDPDHCTIPVPSVECPQPSRKAEMSRGLMLPSVCLSGHKECSLLSDLVGFTPSIDAVPHCLGQGSERQAENQWSDILGCLLVLSAGWLASKARFPGLAVWGVCPGSRSSLPSPTCSSSKLATILVNSGSPPGFPSLR